MKHYVSMLALLSVLILAATSTLVIAEDSSAHLSGSMEVGVSGVDLKDNPARVNEYVTYRSKDDGVNPAGKLNLEYENGGVLLDFDGSVMGRRDQNYNLDLDYNRIFKFDTKYQVFEHWKDHDNLGHIGATMAGDIAGDQPRATTDGTVGQITGATIGGTTSIAEANERYYQELDRDYIITHKEWENEADITVPSLPNVTFHAGYRMEKREGVEQSRTLSKCNQCHVQANPKDIDEETKDLTLGVTGKFGLITIDYEYLSRDFNDDSDGVSYNYTSSGATHNGYVDNTQLLYGGSEESYGQTPDSEKDSHTVKARLDLDRSSSVTATYVHADIESDKDGDAPIYTLSKNTLKSEFESFFLKGATRIGGLRLAIRGGTYEIDGPEYTANYPQLVGVTTLDPALGYDTTTGDVHYESAESRDVTEFGIDGVYRLAKGTTLRLGYEYEEIDRDEDELGDTETNTFDIAVNTRFNKELSGRVSYKYQDIDEPLRGADTGILQSSAYQDPNYPGMAYDDKANYVGDPGNTGTAVFYWNSVYPNRMLETSMDPEDVHEVKFSSTWTPSTNMAATVFGRYRHEENDPVNYKQDTYVPGVSFYYAPNDKMNLTMAYTFNKMETENQMCVGWYHG